jgi:hypothetical protein
LPLEWWVAVFHRVLHSAAEDHRPMAVGPVLEYRVKAGKADPLASRRLTPTVVKPAQLAAALAERSWLWMIKASTIGRKMDVDDS